MASRILFKFNTFKTLKNLHRRDLLTVHESETLQNEDWYRISKLWMEKIFEKKDMTPHEIDEQIKYLLPSGLLFRDARPMLSPPGCVINDWKTIFDKDGNVKSHGYFTPTPRYNDMIYELLRRMHAVDELPLCLEGLDKKFPDLYKGLDLDSLPPNPHKGEPNSINEDTPPHQLDVRWVTKDEFIKIIGDTAIRGYQYIFFIKLMDRLYKNGKSYLFLDFISKFMVVLEVTKASQTLHEKDQNGYVRSVGYRKTAIADILIREGTGDITVNGVPFNDYFKYDLDKLQVMMPLDAIGKRGEFDIVANVINSGPASQAGAIRLAISNALTAFSSDYQDILGEAGLLYRDTRVIERKKFGQHKARKPYKWVKR